ncbi:hypothetical protein QP358_04975 [Nosocomiicoccus ampullae]|nr:hypothetical protein [Nosocomiicoccus ampullae]
MYTLKHLKNLTLGKLYNTEGNEKVIINDFEYLHKNVKNKNTALFVINEKTGIKHFHKKEEKYLSNF